MFKGIKRLFARSKGPPAGAVEAYPAKALLEFMGYGHTKERAGTIGAGSAVDTAMRFAHPVTEADADRILRELASNPGGKPTIWQCPDGTWRAIHTEREFCGSENIGTETVDQTWTSTSEDHLGTDIFFRAGETRESVADMSGASANMAQFRIYMQGDRPFARFIRTYFTEESRRAIHKTGIRSTDTDTVRGSQHALGMTGLKRLLNGPFVWATYEHSVLHRERKTQECAVSHKPTQVPA
jgi:uncharacterized cupin superfamily protein